MTRQPLFRKLFSTLLVVGLAMLPTASPSTAETFFEPQLGQPPAPEQWWLRPQVARQKVGGLTVDTSSRLAVKDFFEAVYEPAFAVPIGWTGSIGSCLAGTTSAAYEEATLDVINALRAMAGLPGDVTFDVGFNGKDQAAGLMMIAEGALNHFPPPTFTCYTVGGAEAAGASNLALGFSGPVAILTYLNDFGPGNEATGHRRWLLYPPQMDMGTGSTDGVNGFDVGSNALWVVANSFGPRSSSPKWVAWPPAGFVPFEMVFPSILAGFGANRWSLSRNVVMADFPPGMAAVDFSSASVSMTSDGMDIPLMIVSRSDQFGDATIVWEPIGMAFPTGSSDRTYTVTVTGVVVNGKAQTHTYDVTLFDPNVADPAEIFSDGFESGDTTMW